MQAYGQKIAKVENPAFDSKVDDDFENRSQIIATTTNDGRHENIWAQDDMRQICRLLNIFCVLTVKFMEKKKNASNWFKHETIFHESLIN